MVTPREIEQQVLALQSSDAIERNRAETRLSSLTADDVRGLLKWSLEEQVKRDSINWNAVCASSILGCGGVIGGVVAILYLLVSGRWNAYTALLSFLAIFAAPLVRKLIKERPSTVERQVLGRLESPAVLAPLLDFLTQRTTPLPYVADLVAAIRRILPKITETYAAELPANTLAELNKIASAEFYRYDVEFVLHVMDVLSRIGNYETLNALRYWKRRSFPWRKPQALKEAAANCAAAIEARLAEQQQPFTLLRAVSMDSPESLLRPSASSADEKPEMLLRPATDEDA